MTRYIKLRNAHKAKAYVAVKGVINILSKNQ